MTLRMELSDNARTIFDKRYSRKDEDGNPTESPEQTVDRVVMNVASVNALYAPPEWRSRVDPSDDRDVPYYDEYPYATAKRQYRWLTRAGEAVGVDLATFGSAIDTGWDYALQQAERYRGLLLRRDFFPNSPTWTGAGTPLGQLAACFVLPVADDLGEGRESIFETLKVAVLIQQTGGGNGFSFGRLRRVGALVRRSMGKASGPVGFMRGYDAVFDIIGQGGTRRGANMAVFPVWHADIRAFIAAKVEEGHVENFNISVGITDEFMAAVEKDGDFDLRDVDGSVVETVRARQLFGEIVAAAWKLGEPGNLFLDHANRQNPCPSRYVLEATNPCGEQWLPPYSNCCLGSINLANFAEWSQTGEADKWNPTFDWDRLAEITRLSAQFLDDVIDANQYVPAVPELEAAAMGERRIGLGIMGLADAMAVLGIRYGSQEGQEFASQVQEFVTYHTMMASIRRSEERGPFGWYENSIYDRKTDSEGVKGLDGKVHPYWTPPTPLVAHVTDFGRPEVNWDNVVGGIQSFGIRNACQLTIAPTGTISNVADLGGSGCEPFFGLAYERTLTQDEEKITLTYANPLLAEALRRSGKDASEITAIAEAVKANKGSVQGVAGVPFAVQEAFVVAADVTPMEHVRMQAVLQRFVDNSISKTINLPKEATEDDVATVYKAAYDLGCKGITIYRQGSREVEVLSVGKDAEVVGDQWPYIYPKAMPPYAVTDGLATRTFPVPTPFGTAQVYVTELREHPGRPFDVRIGFGKAGNDKLADVEALGRSLSINLRAGVAVEVIVDQLEGIGGQTMYGFGPQKVRSVADGVAKLLRRVYMDDSSTSLVVVQSKDEVAVAADPSSICPTCHNATIVRESGCQRCDPRLGGCGDFYKCD